MNERPIDAFEVARRRRAKGTAADFDGDRLALARRLQRRPRTSLARDVGVTPAAISQYEKGQTKPTTPVLAQLAWSLGVTPDFFRHGRPVAAIPSSSAHFRSLRATPALARDQALAFAELSLEVLGLIEQYVDFPRPNLPDLVVPLDPDGDAIIAAASATRAHFGVPHGPIAHVVRLLETNGILVINLPPEHVDLKVDAFSTNAALRPLVMLSPLKNDRARSRFDAAHELGHLVMHHDVEPGLKSIENQAHSFAAEFLMPQDEVVDHLPRRLDWEKFHEAKRYWGTSLKALVYRAHKLKLINDAAYRRGNQKLAEWGYPEPGSLGPPEASSLLGRSAALLTDNGYDLATLADRGQLTEDQLDRVIKAASDMRPRIDMTTAP